MPVDVRETATHYVIVVGDTPIAQHVKAGRHAVVMEPVFKLRTQSLQPR